MSMKQTMCEFVHGMTCEEMSRFVGSIVRCRDCVNASFDEFGGGWCCENYREIKPWDFCAWGERNA